MKSPTLDDIVSLIEHDLPKWSWLIRKAPESKRGAYFANVLSPNFTQSMDPKTGRIKYTGKTTPSYGSTPAEALAKAYRAAEEWVENGD